MSNNTRRNKTTVTMSDKEQEEIKEIAKEWGLSINSLFIKGALDLKMD